MKKLSLEPMAIKCLSTVSVEPKILHKDLEDIAVESYDLPGLSIATYATSTHAIKKKQKQVRQSLQCASDAIKRDLGGVCISVPNPKKKIFLVKFR